MTLSAPTQERNGGVDSDPPVAHAPKAPEREPRIGMLEQPGLWSRLLESWRTGELLPGFDPRSLRTREWRAAGALALAAHVMVFGLVAWLGWRALTVAPVFEDVTMVDPDAFPRPGDEVVRTAPDGAGGDDRGDGGPPAGGGGGKNAVTPASAGVTPRMTLNPPIVAPTPIQPIRQPDLPVPDSILGPTTTTPVEGPSGVPDAPPSLDPSSGPGTGGGIGSGEGQGVGSGTGPGSGEGNGPGSGGPGPGGISGPAIGTTPGTGAGGVTDPNAPKVTRGARMRCPGTARPTPAMIENATFGTVKLWVTVGPGGEVLSITPQQPLPNGGTQAAIEAVRRCKFDPALQAGVPVTQKTLVSIEFSRR